MADLGKLNWTLDANTTRFNAAMHGAQRAVRSIGKSFIALGATATAVGVAISKGLDVADSLSKTSRAIGITVADLQRLQYAAELSGGSAQQLDQALLQFSRRLGTAATGRGDLVEFFKKYDEGALSALTSTKDFNKALELAADIIGKASTQQEKLAVASALFGEGFAKVATEVFNGSEKLKSLKQGFDLIGRVLTEDMAKAAEAANDSIGNLKKIFESTGTYLAASFAPEIKAIVDFIARSLPKAIDVGKQQYLGCGTCWSRPPVSSPICLAFRMRPLISALARPVRKQRPTLCGNRRPRRSRT